VIKSSVFGSAIVAAATILASSSIASAKQDTAPPGSPPPLSEAERNVGIPGVQFSDVIKATGAPTIAEGAVREGEVLLSIPYAYRYTAVVTEDVKGFSFTVGGVQAPTGSPGYYAGSFIQTRGHWGIADGPPMDMWCFLPRVVGGKRENICLLRNSPKRAAIAPTRMNPYLWDHFSPMTGTFDYVNTPIFKRQVVELPIKPVLEYRFLNWKGDVAWFRLHAMGSFVKQLSIPKNKSGEYRLRTVGGDFIVTRDAIDQSSARISMAAREPQTTGRFIRVKLTIGADSRVSNCVILESDAPQELQEKTCEIFRQKGKFTVSSTTIEQMVRFQLPADQWPNNNSQQMPATTNAGPVSKQPGSSTPPLGTPK
jgi:hypothetical protein